MCSIYLLNARKATVLGNTILFTGSNNVGDAIDVLDSTDIDLTRNYVATGSCYGVVILRSQNINFTRNFVVGGITYGLYINSLFELTGPHKTHITNMLRHSKHHVRAGNNINILINENYFSQNRYGMALGRIDGLIVQNNVFLQKFNDKDARKFWTNNDILLKNITNLVWKDNLYKESFSQRPFDDDSISFEFAPFPERGGVNI